MDKRWTRRALLRDERGATAIEYALIAALIAVAAIGAIGGVAGATVAMWGGVSDNVVATAG